MVEPTATVPHRPVLRAIAPPRIEPVGRWDEMTAQIHPIMRMLKDFTEESFGPRTTELITDISV